MLKPIPVILAEYNPAWPELAIYHGGRLRVLGSTLAAVHHIGSTAVPGLIAKPIIDLMPLITDLAELDRHRAAVTALGYSWHGEFGIPGRRYCALCDETGARIVQLHFFRADSPHAKRHLAFRNYLQAHPAVASAYAAEKRRAQNLHPDDSHAYNAEKTAWIQKTEAAALLWSGEH